MQLPFANQAVIEPRKLRDYLLSPSHPEGRFKAAFFAVLGYHLADWGVLSSDLRTLAAEGTVTLGAASRYGQKYEVRGELVGPSGRRAPVVTVWIILIDEDAPRFVTAFPDTRS